MVSFRNVNSAFTGMLSDLITAGTQIDSRNGLTLELPAQTVNVEAPLERFVFAPGRNNNPFAAIAESMWVIAGRNDLAYLTPYLRRAPNFSDDGGVTWRAGYGPRLRNWGGVDQLAAVRHELHRSPMSRRAAISLFDPSQDFQDSRDIPCNNWLHFLSRNGRLDLSVAARSTDVWWGFSGINAFEWSVLLEMMARWLDLEPGVLTFFTSSLHLYEKHLSRARNVLSTAGPDISSYVGRSMFRYDTEWTEAGAALSQWMDLEEHLRTGANLGDLVIPFDDPMLTGYIRALDVFWAFKRGATPSDLEPRLVSLGDTDLAVVAREYVNRPNARDH
ncbi:thymidylate synthase [Cellulomonas sp. ES6]|uniref:thymidylate synthase n=1 Tax=Cellulomonas sp. ES6 TaxID=3039384 RepID=UPI0024B7AC50|nr:thymidylate synthase [Cellulomonas sp. ES6]WHP18933.1 thymidylate synthase [Cellulomonas sp. ES6]